MLVAAPLLYARRDLLHASQPNKEEIMVTLPLVGGCQCGSLRYQVTQPPLMIYNCHCTNCQKLGGGAFGTPAAILEASFSFTSGEPQTFEWTSDAGNRRL